MERRRIVLAFLLLPLASSQVMVGAEKRASLQLRAIPRVAEIPAEIQFYASVRGGRDDDPGLYCLEAEWDFQETVYRDREDCPPPEGDFKIRRTYSAMYTFEKQGTFHVRLTLKLDGNKVLTRRVEVQARKSKVGVKPGGSS